MAQLILSQIICFWVNYSFQAVNIDHFWGKPLLLQRKSEFGWNLKCSQPHSHQEFTLESTCCLNQYFKWCLENQAQPQTYPKKGIHLTKNLLLEWKMTFLTYWQLYIYDGKDHILICDDMYSSAVQCNFSACSEIQ